MATPDQDEKPPARWGRIALAIVGLVVGLIIINGGLNLLSHAGDEPAPAPAPVSTPATGRVTAATATPTRPGSTAPGTVVGAGSTTTVP